MAAGSLRLAVRIVVAAVALISVAACTPEQRPGTVQRIGGPQTGSVSASVSGVQPSSGGPAPTPIPNQGNTPGDGIYTPVGNVDGYLYLGVDLQDINALTNAVNQGNPLPTAEIQAIYENGKNSRTASGALRTLRGFARAEARGQDFPEAAQYYSSPSFLDVAVMDAINGTGPTANFTPAQRRQAIQKSALRVLYYFTLQELRAAIPKIQAGNIEPINGAPHNVDEAWAIYMGLPDGTNYPRSLSATARSREMNFNRDGAIDRPLREALERAKRAAGAGNMNEFRSAQQEVEGRLVAMFYFSTARYINEALKLTQAGNTANAGVNLAEGYYYYMSIQPLVARADATADQAVTAYYRSDPSTLTVAGRDEALAALNRTLQAIGLTDRDRVSPSDLQ
jgi:hypothetical protein